MKFKKVVYGAVIFEGPLDQVAKAKEELSGRRLQLIGTSGSTIGFSNISHSVLPDLKKHLAENYDLQLLHCYQPKEVEVVPRQRTASVQKNAQLSLEPRKWYFLEAGEDYYPFLFVRDVEEADGNQVFEVELLSGENAMPTRLRVFSDDLAQLGLRPATTDDFTAYDIPPPEDSLLTKAAVTAPSTSPKLSSLSNFVNQN
jgi:hypothetical protein